MDNRSEGKIRSPTDYNFLRVDAQHGNRTITVPKSTSDFVLLQRDRRSHNGDDKTSVVSHEGRIKSPSPKKKSAWRSFSRLTQNSRSRSVSRLFTRTERMTETVDTYSIEDQKLRSSKSLFNFRFLGALNGDHPNHDVETPMTESSFPHSQSQMFQSFPSFPSSATVPHFNEANIPAKRFRPRPKSEIICEADSINAAYNRRRSFTPVSLVTVLLLVICLFKLPSCLGITTFRLVG